MPANRIVHVVDDDPAFLRSMEVLLDSLEFATRTYDSAPAVLNAASQLSDGCTLLDVQMPGMNDRARRCGDCGAGDESRCR
jgi:two-component system response regulator FixJ